MKKRNKKRERERKREKEKKRKREKERKEKVNKNKFGLNDNFFETKSLFFSKTKKINEQFLFLFSFFVITIMFSY